MRVSRFLLRSCVAATVLVSIGAFTAGTASAGPSPTCTAVFTPSEFTIYLDDLEAVVTEQSTVFAGGWGFYDSPQGWYRIDDGTPVALPTEVSDGATDVPVPAENLVSLLSQFLSYDPADGDTITLTVWVTTDPSPTFDENNMQCSAVAEITFEASSPLPDTGTHATTLWFGATALLGIGAVSLLASSRRRA